MLSLVLIRHAEADEKAEEHRLQANDLAHLEARAAKLDRLHALVVADNGKIVLERHLAGPGVDRLANIKSLSKTVLAALVSGESTLALAWRLLGEPLDITIPAWPRDPQGVYFGGNDMRLSPRALVQIGELYRNDGIMDGHRVLPENWVDDSWQPRTARPAGQAMATAMAGSSRPWPMSGSKVKLPQRRTSQPPFWRLVRYCNSSAALAVLIRLVTMSR